MRFCECGSIIVEGITPGSQGWCKAECDIKSTGTIKAPGSIIELALYITNCLVPIIPLPWQIIHVKLPRKLWESLGNPEYIDDVVCGTSSGGFIEVCFKQGQHVLIPPGKWQY